MMIHNNKEDTPTKVPFDLTALLFVLLVMGLAAAAIFEVVNPAAEAYLSSLLIEIIPFQEIISYSISQEMLFTEVGQSIIKPYFSIEWLFKGPGFLVKLMLFPLTVFLATFIMLLKKTKIHRSYKLQDLSQIDPELEESFKELVNEMGIIKAPIFYWSPRETREAFVFRGFGPYKICFTKGMIDCFKNRRKQLEAVAAHELGHIVNKDVTRTEIAESLVKSYFTLWIVVALLQAGGSLGMHLVFQQSSIAMDISFAISLISLGFIYVILNILSRIRQKYADAQVVKLGRQEDLQEALSYLATAYAAGEVAELQGARRLAFGFFKNINQEIPSFNVIKQWILSPDPTIWERMETVVNPAVLQQPVRSLSLAAGFIVFSLTGVLPLSPLAGIILAWFLASLLVGAGISTAMSNGLRGKNLLHILKLSSTHLILCGTGYFLGSLLFSLTNHLASSMPIPTEIAENMLKVEGLVSPSLASLSSAALESLQNTIYFLPGLVLGLVIVSAGWPAVSWLSHKMAILFKHSLLNTGLYSLTGLFLTGIFFYSSTGVFLGASYFAEGYREQIIRLTPVPISTPGDPHGVSSLPINNYISPAIIEKALNDAAYLYEKSISTSPDFIWPYIQLAQIYLLRGDINETIELLTQEPLENKQSSIAFTLRGIAYNAAGQKEKAIQDYSTAIKLDPESFAPYKMRAEIIFDKGKHEEAIEAFSRVLDVYPKSQAAYTRRAVNYMILENYEEAIDDFAMAIVLWDRNFNKVTEDFNYLVNQHLLSIDHAASYEPNLHWYSLSIKVLQMNLFSQVASGETLVHPYRQLYHQQYLYLMKGHCYNQLKQYESAQKNFEKATIPPDNARANDYSAGLAFLYLKEYDEAVSKLSNALLEYRNLNFIPNYMPYIKELLFYRGTAYTLKGNVTAALADFAECLDLPPGTPDKDILHMIKPELDEQVYLKLKNQVEKNFSEIN